MARARCKLPTPCLAMAELALVAIVEESVSPSDDGPRGPGWFDSSWDLQRGLDVREGLPADAKLAEWLAICLGRDARTTGLGTYRAKPPAATLRATASPRSITAIA